MSRPIVVIACMFGSSESWGLNSTHIEWHFRAGGGAVHSIKLGHRPDYSTTSAAATRRLGGAVSPSAFAVLRFRAVSNLVAACTGRSAGLSPRRMRPEKNAASRAGGGEQRGGDINAERPRGLEGNDKLDLRRLENWQIGRLCSLENLSN